MLRSELNAPLMRVSKEQLMRDEAERSAAKIQAELLANREDKKAHARPNPQVGKAQDIRRTILSLSLFPNIHNNPRYSSD